MDWREVASWAVLRRLLARRRPATAAQPGRLELAIAAYNRRDWSAAEPLFQRVIRSSDAPMADRQIARNIYGALLQRTRRLEQAIRVWEANVAEGFVGGYPYERLVETYRRRGRLDEARRVLTEAIAVYERALGDGRTEAAEELEHLRAALARLSDPPA